MNYGLTEKELLVFSRICDNEYEEGIWCNCIWQPFWNFPERFICGVLSSLVKKGLINIYDNEYIEGRKRKTSYSKDMVAELTDMGKFMWKKMSEDKRGK